MVGGVPSWKVCAGRERQEHSSQTAVCHPSDAGILGFNSQRYCTMYRLPLYVLLSKMN
jgi:hypothetical protein